MKNQIPILSVLSFTALVGTALAADQVAVPNGCAPLATIHKAMCHTTTMMDCGDRREAWTYNNGEPIVVHVYASDWDMKQFRYADGQALQMTAVPNSGSTMDLADAVASGSVPETGVFLMSTNIIKDRKYTLDGRIEMPGETVDLNGVSFYKGRIYRTFELKPGAGGLEFEVDVYVAQDRDLIFEASWQRSIFGNNLEVFDQTPHAVYFAGEAGFLAAKPEIGCE